jgi:hypothetical protein
MSNGTYKECLNYIKEIVETEGYWTQDTLDSFKEVFIEPI